MNRELFSLKIQCVPSSKHFSTPLQKRIALRYVGKSRFFLR